MSPKYCACFETKRGRVIQSAAPVMQTRLSKPEDLMLQYATFLTKSAPWPPNIWWRCLLHCTCHAKFKFADPLQTSDTCHRLCNWTHSVLFTCWLRNVLRATMRHNGVHFFTCQLPKADRDRQFLTLLTSKRASRNNSVHYLNISADKSAPNPRFFNMFTSKHVLRHNALHFVNIWTSKSAPKKVCFVHFWLRNLLCRTVACTFSTAQLPKVLRE